jgi:hypothetical protein
VFRPERIVVSRLLATPSHTPKPHLTRSNPLGLFLEYVTSYMWVDVPPNGSQMDKESETETRPPLNDSQDSPTRDAPPSCTCSPPTGDPDDDGGYLVLHLQYLHRAGKHGTHQLLSCELHTPVFSSVAAVGFDRDHCLIQGEFSFPSQRLRSTT